MHENHQSSAIANPQLRCTHTHPTGRRCGAFALRGERFCYHHHPSRPASRRERAAARTSFGLPPLVSGRNIQIALVEISMRLADNTLDTKRAALLLQCVHTAAAAIARAPHST